MLLKNCLLNQALPAPEALNSDSIAAGLRDMQGLAARFWRPQQSGARSSPDKSCIIILMLKAPKSMCIGQVFCLVIQHNDSGG